MPEEGPIRILGRWCATGGVRVVASGVLLVVAAAAAAAAEPPLDLTGRFAAFDVLNLDGAERLLGEAAGAGFRLVDLRAGFRAGWTVGGYAALLARGGGDAGPPVYRMVVRDKIDGIEAGLNEAAMEGFQLRPGGFFSQRRGAQPFQDEEFVAVMERSSPPGDSRHYRVLAGDDLRGGPLRLTVQRGYEIVGFGAGSGAAGTHRRDVPVAILEIRFRAGERDPGLASEEPYRLVEGGGAGALRSALARAAAEGFRLIGSTDAGAGAFHLLRNDPAAASRDYRLPKRKRLLLDLDEAGAQGFRLLPFTWDVIPVLERRAGEAAAFSYRLIGSADPDDADPAAWSAALEAAAGEGFRVLRLTAPLQALVELERRAATP